MLAIKKVKIKQATVIDITKLCELAQESGIKDIAEMAKWIISVSPYWRSKGYAEIIITINQIGSAPFNKK